MLFRSIIDRLTVSSENDAISRLTDSIETAFNEGHGICILKFFVEKEGQKTFEQQAFSKSFDADGMTFDLPSVHMFSFNSPLGACPTCEGFGRVIGIDEDLVVPNKTLSIYEDAVACWRGEVMGEWKQQLIQNAYQFNFPVHKPYYELSDEQRDLL